MNFVQEHPFAGASRELTAAGRLSAFFALRAEVDGAHRGSGLHTRGRA